MATGLLAKANSFALTIYLRNDLSMGDNKKILLVDDYMFARGIIRRCLMEHSCQVDEADNGQQAWEKLDQACLEKKTYDLVFLDLQMPQMDGLKLLKKCKSDSRMAKTEFVIVTGQKENSIIVEVLAAGAMDYILKPLNVDDCKIKVQEILHRLK